MQFALDCFERYGQLDAPVVFFVPFVGDEVFEAVGDSPSTVIRVSAPGFTEGMQQVKSDAVGNNLHWGFVQGRIVIPLVLGLTNHVQKVQAICGS